MTRNTRQQRPLAPERAQIEEIATLTSDLLEKRYTAAGKKKLRGVHPKSHGCVDASFVINSDIAPELRQGLFANPGKKFRAIIRFSNATALVTDDINEGKHASRGAAIKVFVPENARATARMIRNSTTQDFLLINSPSFAFSHVSDYLRLTQVITQDNDNPARFFTPLANPAGFTNEQIASAKKTFGLIQQITNTAVADPLDIKYFGAAPFRFGPRHIMRFAIVPSVSEPGAATQMPQNPSPNYLREALKKRMNSNTPIAFDFVAQIRRRDEENLMLEDASSHWDETQFAFVPLAKIHIETPQANFDSAAHEEECEKLEFSPWHSLLAHEPLGGINRLRQRVYEASATTRLSGENPRSPRSGNSPRSARPASSSRGSHLE